MNYYCVNILFKDKSSGDYSEIIPAWLSDCGFDSFTDDDNGIKAFIPETDFDEKAVTEQLEWIKQQVNISWEFRFIPDENWNREWEKNFDPVTIAGRCMVRAPFHQPDPNIEFDLVIMPKMSFGTAHHETTRMMIEFILEQDWEGKEVLDMGSGTGVLAILASRMGAKRVVAVDNDSWAYENACENTERNLVNNVTTLLGDEKTISEMTFDVIIANINRNILLQHLPSYLNSLKSDGKLFMSGFYEEDIPILLVEADKSGLEFKAKKLLNKWAAIMIG
ncbi:MAG: 50S ribosomal protein L11 methyltransferase [Bacteroidales bacterium]|nr:50S ribosomal protein L11 methyltransferase [Bacteroidales bacterium]